MKPASVCFVLLFAALQTAGEPAAVRVDSVGATHISALMAQGEYVYAGTWGQGVLRSLDGGEAWEEKSAGLGNRFIYTLAPWSGILLAGSRNGIYVSYDGAGSWHALGRGIGDRHVFSIVAIGQTLLAGTWRRGMLRSSDAGETWHRVGGEMAVRVVYGFETHDDTVWAGTSEHGVYRSVDRGTSWRRAGLQGSSVLALAYAGGRLYAGTWDRGIYERTGNDTAWAAVGLEGRSVRTISVAGSAIFAVQQDARVLRYSLDTMRWEPFARLPCEGTSLIRHEGAILAGTWGCGLYALSQSDPTWAAPQSQPPPRPSQTARNSPRHDLSEPRTIGTNLSLWDTMSSTAAVCSSNTPVVAGIAVCRRKRGNAVTIRYSVPRRIRARVCVFDLNGSKIASLVHGIRSPGIHTLCLDPLRYQPGVYVVELCIDFVKCKVRVALAVDG